MNGGSATQGVPGRVYSVAGVFEQTLHCVQGTLRVPQGWTIPYYFTSSKMSDLQTVRARGRAAYSLLTVLILTDNFLGFAIDWNSRATNQNSVG